MTQIMDGKALSEKIYERIKTEVAKLEKKPTLAVIITSDNEAGKIYVRNKKRACENTGINSITVEFDETVSDEEFLSKIDELNKNPEVDAIMVQLPIPRHLDTEKILNSISPEKDADGLHYINAGKLFTGQIPNSVACTPKGIIRANTQLLSVAQISSANRLPNF